MVVDGNNYSLVNWRILLSHENICDRNNLMSLCYYLDPFLSIYGLAVDTCDDTIILFEALAFF